jgi:hypothetical protein
VPVVNAIPRLPCDDSFNVKPIPWPMQLTWSASLQGHRLAWTGGLPVVGVSVAAGAGRVAESRPRAGGQGDDRKLVGPRIEDRQRAPGEVGSATPPGVPATITGPWERRMSLRFEESTALSWLVIEVDKARYTKLPFTHTPLR